MNRGPKKGGGDTRSLKSGLVLPTQIFGLFGPPKKARKFRQIWLTTKVRILCFEWKRICFQTRDLLCSYNMNYEE